MSQSISVSDRPRCNRHILVMSPEPKGRLDRPGPLSRLHFDFSSATQCADAK